MLRLLLAAAAAAAVLALAGCEDRMRYFCQDWAHWQLERCQKPKCLAAQDCTEFLIDIEERKP